MSFHNWRHSLCRRLSHGVVVCRCFVSRLLRMHGSFLDSFCRSLSHSVGLIL